MCEYVLAPNLESEAEKGYALETPAGELSKYFRFLERSSPTWEGRFLLGRHCLGMNSGGSIDREGYDSGVEPGKRSVAQ